MQDEPRNSALSTQVPVTRPGDLVIDPAADGFPVMHVATEMQRWFFGCAGRAMSRERLPNRRAAGSFELQASGLRFTCSVGRFADGRLAEIFLTNHKTGSHADTAARDSAIAFSIAVQHGADPESIRSALCHDVDGTASGPLGVALDLIFGQER